MESSVEVFVGFLASGWNPAKEAKSGVRERLFDATSAMGRLACMMLERMVSVRIPSMSGCDFVIRSTNNQRMPAVVDDCWFPVLSVGESGSLSELIPVSLSQT